jgi:hypothetical protein
MSMPPNTELNSDAAPQEIWRNRDYAEAEEARRTGKIRRMRIVAAVLSAFMLVGLLWGSLQPLLQ